MWVVVDDGGDEFNVCGGDTGVWRFDWVKGLTFFLTESRRGLGTAFLSKLFGVRSIDLLCAVG